MKEFQERGRAGGIVDRRFGEKDPSMSLDERMLERFTQERQRAAKGNVFNLEDEEELTHYGQNLSKLDDFDNVGLPMDEDDDEGEHACTVELKDFLFNLSKVKLTVILWGEHTLADSATRMRRKKTTMCVSLMFREKIHAHTSPARQKEIKG